MVVAAANSAPPRSGDACSPCSGFSSRTKMTSFDPSAALHKLGRINDLRPISVFDFCHLLRSAPIPYNPCFAAATAFLCLSFRLTTPSLSALNRGEAGTNRYPERRQLQPLPQHRSIGTDDRGRGEEREREREPLCGLCTFARRAVCLGGKPLPHTHCLCVY